MSGLEIFYDKETQMSNDTYIVEERLALTEDGERLVPEDSPEARWLYAIPGQEIPLADAQRFGLVKPAKSSQKTEAEPESPNRQELVARAKELGIKPGRKKDDALAAEIAAAEAAQA